MSDLRLLYTPTFESVALAEKLAKKNIIDLAKLDQVRRFTLWLAGPFSAMTLMFLYELSKFPSESVQSKLGGFLIFLVLTFGTYFTAWIIAKKRIQSAIKQSLAKTQVQLVANSEQILFSDTYTVTRFPTEEFSSFHIQDDCLCLNFLTYTIAIPLSAFQSETEKDSFMNQIAQLRKLAKEKKK